MTINEGGEEHEVTRTTTERERQCHHPITGDFKTTISLKSSGGDGMMRRCCRRGEDPMRMMILDNDNEVMIRRQWP